MNAIETLISVLCDPEGKCCISGSDDDRRLIDSALAELTPTAQAAESVPAPPPPPECETEAEKRAFAFGWFKAQEADRAARAPADSVTAPAGGVVASILAAARSQLSQMRAQRKSLEGFLALGNEVSRAARLDEEIQLLAGALDTTQTAAQSALRSDWVKRMQHGLTTHDPVLPASDCAARALADSVLEDAARLDFIERHPEMSLRHRKGRWAFLGFTNYEYDLHQSLREAIDAAMANGGSK